MRFSTWRMSISVSSCESSRSMRGRISNISSTSCFCSSLSGRCAAMVSARRPGRLADTIAAHLPLKLEQKQEVLEMFEIRPRIERLLSQLETEIDILQVEKRIRGRVKRQMEKSQREYYLNEQVKAIQKELGEGEDGADLDEMEKKIKAAGMTKEALTKTLS